MTNKPTLLASFPLFFVLFIDGMGMGLFFPILNSVVVDPTASFLAHATSIAQRDFVYGAIVGIFMLCWFFGAAFLGDLSDTIGRKKSLMICLLGAFIGYFISAIAVVMQSIFLLFLGRIIAGFTAGSQAIAQAAIVDISTEENKTRNIGLILLALSLGFVFGPLLGGLLADKDIVSWFDFSTPLYFAAGIAFLNAVFLWFLFQETFHRTEKITLRFDRAIHIFISAFKHIQIRELSFILLIMIFGWSNYFTFITLFLLNVYHLTPLQNALSMAALGVGFSVGCGFLVNYCARHYNLTRVVLAFLVMCTLIALTTLLVHRVEIVVFCMFAMGTTLSVAYSTLVSIFSSQVSPEEQGWVMGVTGSIMALCFGLTSIVTGLIASIGPSMPMIFSAIGFGVSAIMMWKLQGQFDREAVTA